MANQALIEKLYTFARMWIILLDQVLPDSYDSASDEFFAVSLQRTRVIISILPSEEAQAWLAECCLEECRLEPLHQISTPHFVGLNFSRARGVGLSYNLHKIRPFMTSMPIKSLPT